MTHPNLVVMAGGVSSRMKIGDPSETGPSVSVMSKSMIPVAGETPFLDYILYNARAAGYRDVVLVTGENASEMRTRYGASDHLNPYHGLLISYAVQKIPAGRSKPLGTADALLTALRLRPDWKGGTFTVCNGDNLYSQQAFRILLETHYPNAMIDYDRNGLKFEHSRIEQFAVIAKDENGFLTRIIEKPSSQQMDQIADADGRVGVSMNIFRFAYDTIVPILERVPLDPIRQEKELARAVMMLVKEGPEGMMTMPLTEYVPDLTRRSDIDDVRRHLNIAFRDFTLDQS